MIALLSGTLFAKTPPRVIIQTAGLGYEVDLPMSSFYGLPAIGQPVTLLTHLVVREDAHLLYGFVTEGERAAFRELIKISGIGPRIALAVLSGLSVDQLSQAVALQDAASLVKVPGIGKKTAERMLLELKGRLADALPGAAGRPTAAEGSAAEVSTALLALGYSEKEALAAVRALPPGLDVAEGIRQALKQLVR
ncbi:MAG: Holliday junction branch migration protein RuvA [Burkholderiaceae bacterium]